MQINLLQVGQTNIVNPTTGAQLRNYHLARQLAKAMNVCHLGFDDSRRTLRDPEPGDISITLVPKDRPYTVEKLIRGSLGRIPAGILNYQSRAMNTALKLELAATRYDIVQIEGVELFLYLGTVLNTPRRPRAIVWDWHNIESELMDRYSQRASTPFHKTYLRRTVRQLKILERELLAKCDLHLVTSEREGERLLQIRPDIRVLVIENGVDTHYFGGCLGDQVDSNSRNRILFVGSMDYHPNIDAVQYFCDEVWPRLHYHMPSAIFTIVGRNPSSRLLELGRRPGVEVTGTVLDVRPYYQKAFVVVVPLRMGGGTRLKILEAMAAGLPVVSTSAGMEGLRAQPGLHLEVADTPDDFQFYVNSLRNDYEYRKRLSGAARKLVEERYDWNVIGRQLIKVYCDQFGPYNRNNASMPLYA